MDHFPIITAILGILVGLVVRPTDAAVRERSVTTLAKEPGFQFDLLDNVVNSGSEQAAASLPYSDRKQFSLRNCELFSYQALNGQPYHWPPYRIRSCIDHP